MKNHGKRVVAVLLAAMVCFLGIPSNVKAANKVTIHVQDTQNWGAVNIYNWGDAGEIFGAWMGEAMESEGDNWYVKTVESDYILKLVLTVDTNGDGQTDAQTGNVDDIDPAGGEYWIVIESGTEDGVYAAGTYNATLYSEPQEGFPTVANQDTTTEEATLTSTETESTTDETPKTGDTTAIGAVAFLGIASAVVIILSKKKVAAR